MHRRIAPALAAALLGAPALAAQLPQVTAPAGTMWITFAGEFNPTDREWVAGKKLPLGNPLTTPSLDAGRTPLIADLEARIRAITGTPGSSLSLGGVTATAEHEHGVGTISLGLGLTSRVTAFMNVPLVLVRSRYQLAYDPTTATVGINPANPDLGTGAGVSQTTEFFTQFDSSLRALQNHLAAGDYDPDPAVKAVAQETLGAAPELRAALYTLFADPTHASAVLPVATSPEGQALLARIDAMRATYTNTLGIDGFSTDPALPSVPLTEGSFDALLAAPTGLGLSPADDQPHMAIGDVEGGLAIQLLRPGDDPLHSRALWARALVRFPNGTLPRSSVLFDQGTGDRQFDAELTLIGELHHGSVGLRGEAGYTRQFAKVLLAPVAGPAQFLVPTYRYAALSRDLGDMFTVTARPFLRVAPHLALAGEASYWSKGSDRYAYATGQAPVADALLSEMSAGTAANALRLGIGLSYSHPGEVRHGVMTMPVEAGFAIERTVTSGSGYVPAPLTTRMFFRVYKSIFRR